MLIYSLFNLPCSISVLVAAMNDLLGWIGCCIQVICPPTVFIGHSIENDVVACIVVPVSVCSSRRWEDNPSLHEVWDHVDTSDMVTINQTLELILCNVFVYMRRQ